MHKRKSLLNSKYKTAHLHVECAVDTLFCYGPERRHLAPYACIGKDNINAPLVLRNLRVESVKVFQLRNIPLDGRNILSNLRNRNIELLLSPSGDVYVRPLGDELFCCGESHSAAAACDDGNFTLKSVQSVLLFADRRPFSIIQGLSVVSN